MAQIRGVSWAMSAITNDVISFKAAILITAVVVGIYVYFGGFTSQAWVDTAQGLLFIVILWGCLFIVAGTNGGYAESWRRLIESAPDVLYYKDTSSVLELEAISLLFLHSRPWRLLCSLCVAAHLCGKIQQGLPQAGWLHGCILLLCSLPPGGILWPEYARFHA